MARKRSKLGLLFGLALLLVLLKIVVDFMIRVIKLFYDLIAIYATGYKRISGYGFLATELNNQKYGEFLLYKKVYKILCKDNIYFNVNIENKNKENLI